MSQQKIVATIEARMASSRLPGKVLLPLEQKNILWHLCERLKRVHSIDQIIIATTVNPAEDPIIEFAKENNIAYYRGSEEDVLLRVLETAKSVNANIIVEITGDCPLLDPDITEQAIQTYCKLVKEKQIDYVSNVLKKGFPLGLAVQVFSYDLLNEVHSKTTDAEDREHVSLYIYKEKGRYKTHHIECPAWLNYPEWRWTLDYPEDYDFIKEVYTALYPTNPNFTSRDIVAHLKNSPQTLELNANLQQHKPYVAE
jgi:spore coat polysaccharide biosynthesis protein SpsF